MSDSPRSLTPGPSAQTLENVKVWSRSTFLVLVACLGTGYFPGVAAVATLLLGAITVGFAITTLVKMAQAKFPAFSILLMVMVALWALFLMLSAGLQLIFAEATAAYADCLQNALTLERQEQCSVQMSDGLMKSLMGQ